MTEKVVPLHAGIEVPKKGQRRNQAQRTRDDIPWHEQVHVVVIGVNKYTKEFDIWTTEPDLDVFLDMLLFAEGRGLEDAK